MKLQVCVTILIALLPLLTWADCKFFPGINFDGHDLIEYDENTPEDCCNRCLDTDGCGYWTYAPPEDCLLKLSDAGRQPAPANQSYTSGCRFENCTAPPTPAPTTPPPTDHVCEVGTLCAHQFSGDGYACCPYEDGVCCPNTMTCCPAGSTCRDDNWNTTCIAAPKNETIGLPLCKAGAPLPFSKSLPNVLIIGDSVSIGYTSPLAKKMQDIALVQHSPYDSRDGGAEETAYGVLCLDYMLQSPEGDSLKPDVIMFNWGLHNGPDKNETLPGQAGLPNVYAQELEEITQMLIAKQPQAKLLFALTSPYMCAAQNDGCVMNLNNQAAVIMAKYKIPTINLHDTVVAECGPPPQPACFNVSNCFCPHCSNVGYDFLVDNLIAPKLTEMLPSKLDYV